VTVTAEMVTWEHLRWRRPWSLLPTAEWMSGPQGPSAVPIRGFRPGSEMIGGTNCGAESDVPTTSVRLPVTVAFRAAAENGKRADANVIRAMVGPGVTSRLLAWPPSPERRAAANWRCS
jgi:hypothetical protein